eukprot:10922691-Karenia_brevis.AAC.1
MATEESGDESDEEEEEGEGESDEESEAGEKPKALTKGGTEVESETTIQLKMEVLHDGEGNAVEKNLNRVEEDTVEKFRVERKRVCTTDERNFEAIKETKVVPDRKDQVDANGKFKFVDARPQEAG